MQLRQASVIVSFVAFAGSAFAGGTITSGNASLQYVDSPIWSAALGNGTLKTDTTATDQLYKDTWYYRTPANNTNRVFSSLDTPTETYTGDTATVKYTNAGPGSSGFERFDANFTVKLFDGGSPNQVLVWEVLKFKARAENSGPVTYQLFHLVDLDLGSLSGDDSISTLNNTGIRVEQTDTPTGNKAQIEGIGATRYEINSGSNIRAKLNGTANNLATASGTTASTFSGDACAAFQWTVTLSPGQEVTIESAYTIGLPVPAPASFALTGLAGLVALRRRR